MYRKKTVIMIAMIAAVMLMALGYAAFATRLNINATGNITSTWNVYFSNITEGVIVGTASNNTPPSVSGTTAYFDMNLRLPGESITYEVTLTNGGTVGAIISDIKAEAEGSSAIIYSISGIKVGDKLAGGASKKITVKTEYGDVMDQPSVTSKTLVITIDAVQDVGQTITQSTPSVEQVTQLRSAILKDNTAYADNVSSPNVTASTGIDLGQGGSTTNGQGLYYTSTNTEDNQRTYYFRGAVENNYVKFGKFTTGLVTGYHNTNPIPSTKTFTSMSECQKDSTYNKNCTATYNVGDDILWRIVRINEDGSIRLIYQGILNDTTTSTPNYSIGNNYYYTAPVGQSYYYNSDVGYMHGTRNSTSYAATHANTNDSTVKGIIDSWYETTLKNNYSSYLADAGFCNDRSIASSAKIWNSSDTALGYGTNITYYGSYNRSTRQVQFACPNSKNDLFTLTSGTKGNKALDYPVGLITRDEAVYAGAATGGKSYFAGSHEFWTMTPSNYISSNAYIYIVNTTGPYMTTTYSIGSRYVRPVINLKADVEITSGDGTSANAYVIKTN